MRPPCLLLWLCLGPAAAAGAAGPCGLRCWLRGLVVRLPDQRLEARVLGAPATATASDAVLSGADVAALAAGRPRPGSLALGATGLAATVSMQLTVQWLLSRVETGVNVTVSEGSLDLEASLLSAPDGLLASLRADRCSVALRVDRVDFSGPSLAAHVLAALRPLVRALLEASAPRLLCAEGLVPLVDVGLSGLAANCSAALRPWLLPPALPLPLPPAPAGSLDLRNALVDALRWGLGEVVGPAGAAWALGRLTRGACALRSADVDAAAAWATGRPADVASLLRARLLLPLAGGVAVDVAVAAFGVAGLCAWEDFGRLAVEPADARTLLLPFAARELRVNASFGLGVAVGGSLELRENATAELWASGPSLALDVRALVDAARAAHRATDVDCVLAALDGVALPRAALNATVRSASVGVAAGEGAEADVAALVNTVAGLVVEQYAAALPAMANKLAHDVLLPLADAALRNLTASRECTAHDAGRPLGYNARTTRWALVAAACCSLLVAPVPLAVALARRRRAARGSPLGALAALMGADGDGPALLCDARLSLWARVAVPVVALFNAAAFISAATSVIISVLLRLEFASAGQPARVVETGPLYEYDLVHTVSELWRARIYPLALIVGGLSGVWPFVKLAALLACWCLPTRALPVAARARALALLDLLGKWSFVDMFAMATLMVAARLRVSAQSHDPALTDAPAAASSVVAPCWGLDLFLWATIASLALSDVALFLCKRADALGSGCGRAAACASDDDGARSASLLELYPSLGPRWRRSAQALTLAVAVLSLAFTIAGGVVPSVLFRFDGAVGAIMEDVLRLPVERTFSAVGLLVALPQSTPVPGSASSRALQAILLAAGYVLPVASAASAVLLLLVPTGPRRRRQAYAAVHVLSAWSCIDVFAGAVLAALLEFGQLSVFMADSMCGRLNDVIALFFLQDTRGSALCLALSGRLLRGFWVLLAAALLQLATYVAVTLAFREALGDARVECAPLFGQRRKRSSASPADNSNTEMDI
eukprot:m51a1_g7040 hypothetical protein (1012) ;mRNA; f:108179-111893